jgi:tetratricopeptide (TPR) repeat protein
VDFICRNFLQPVKPSLTIFALILSLLPAGAQNLFNDAWLAAHRADSSGRHEEAAALYLEAWSLCPDGAACDFVMIQAAHCYVKESGDPKANYWRAIRCGPVDVSYQKRGWSIGLADLYLQEGKYDSALLALRFAGSLRSVKNLCGSNNLQRRADFQYRIMQALAGLGQLDSAIAVFRPLAFQSMVDGFDADEYTCHQFPGDYHCQVRAFIALLETKYGKAAVRKACLELPERWKIRLEYSEQEQGTPLLIEIPFLGKTDVINNGTYTASMTGEEKAWMISSTNDALHSMTLYRLFAAPGDMY